MSKGLRERHKAERRESILAAARDLLRSEPSTPPTTARIAERAAVAPATVYNLIGPREKLWEALAGTFMTELERRLERGGPGAPLERARRIVRETVALIVEDPVVWHRMLRGWEASGLVLRRDPGSHLREAFEEARAQGLLRPDADPARLAAVVASACLGAVHQWAAGSLDDARLRTRALDALDVAIAAGRR